MKTFFFRLVNMDVTRDDHVAHAVEYVAENLPAGEPGRTEREKKRKKI